jgi:MFS family permease
MDAITLHDDFVPSSAAAESWPSSTLSSIAPSRYRRQLSELDRVPRALTTGLSAFAWDWVAFGVLRFCVGVTIGSEWATGASIVSELWPDHARARAAACCKRAPGSAAFLPLVSGWC